MQRSTKECASEASTLFVYCSNLEHKCACYIYRVFSLLSSKMEGFVHSHDMLWWRLCTTRWRTWIFWLKPNLSHQHGMNKLEVVSTLYVCMLQMYVRTGDNVLMWIVLWHHMKRLSRSHSEIYAYRYYSSVMNFIPFAESENLWALTNLTDPIVLDPLGSHQQSFGGFSSNSNSSLAQLHSFSRPSIRHLSNFTDIFNIAVENDYTNSMWDGDTTLVIFLFNLTMPMRFRITVDQQDFVFLLYFFITFITYVGCS